MNLNPALRKLVEDAGRLAIQEQLNLTAQSKSDQSIVTNGDIKVSDFLTKGLKGLYPDFEIYSEEESKVLPTGNKVIIIDPIDGTQSYFQRETTWCILIGFVENDQTSLGIVYQPMTEMLYWAHKGHGAFMTTGNGPAVKLQAKPKGGSLKAICALIPSKIETDFLLGLKLDLIHPYPSAGLKLAEVAKGNFDLYPNFQKKCSIWDVVAPKIILREAGGKIVYKNGLILDFKNPLVDQDFIAVGPNFLGTNLF